MEDLLLKFYKEELNYYHQEFDAFGKKHPSKAVNFGISSKVITDPALEQFVQKTALSNAMRRYELEDNYSELTQAMLLAIQPHYQLPIPAMGIVKFLPDFGSLDTHLTLSKGEELRVKDAEGAVSYSCMTCYDTTVWPIEVADANFTTQVENLLKKTTYPTQAALTLSLSCPGEVSFDGLLPSSLRFFINAPREQACQMYEWLMSQTVAINS